MSDNKKYYYIKLKDNYFDQDNIKILESVPNGHIYSLIIVKLYLKATKYGGQLRMTESIPYDPTKLDVLANVLNHDVAHVKEAIKLSGELGIISILDTGAMWMSEIQNFIGNSSSEADRIREYRSGLKKESVQLYDKSTPEIEKEIEKELEKEIKEDAEKNTKEHFNKLWVMYPRERRPDSKKNVTSKTKKILFNISEKEWQRVLDRYKKEYPDYKFWKHCFRFMNNETFNIYLDVNYVEPKQTTNSKPDKWKGEQNFDF